MSDFQKALNEIQSLFTQTGIPPGQAQDITQRLTAALSSYYDYRAGISSESRTVDSSSANSSDYTNRFRAAEAGRATSQNGRAGKDGIRGQDGWGTTGGTGGDGEAGQDGQQGEAGYSGRDGRDGTSVGLKLQKEIDDLKKRIEDLEENSTKTDCPTCCKGKFYKQDACAILEQQANELKKIKKKLGLPVEPDPDEPDINDIDERLKAVEKAINEDAVDCP